MSLQFKCPSCGTHITVNYLKVGEEAVCNSCEKAVTVPADTMEVDGSHKPYSAASHAKATTDDMVNEQSFKDYPTDKQERIVGLIMSPIATLLSYAVLTYLGLGKEVFSLFGMCAFLTVGPAILRFTSVNPALILIGWFITGIKKYRTVGDLLGIPAIMFGSYLLISVFVASLVVQRMNARK